MGTVLTEKRHTGAHVASEANGQRSRENIVIASGQNLGVGRVLGQITASKKYVALNPGASDGSQNAAGALYAAVDATSSDKPGVGFVRDCELKDGELDWGSLTTNQITAAKAQLAALGVIVRPTL